jgi:hypothetical protein
MVSTPPPSTPQLNSATSSSSHSATCHPCSATPTATESSGTQLLKKVSVVLIWIWSLTDLSELCREPRRSVTRQRQQGCTQICHHRVFLSCTSTQRRTWTPHYPRCLSSCLTARISQGRLSWASLRTSTQLPCKILWHWVSFLPSQVLLWSGLCHLIQPTNCE